MDEWCMSGCRMESGCQIITVEGVIILRFSASSHVDIIEYTTETATIRLTDESFGIRS